MKRFAFILSAVKTIITKKSSNYMYQKNLFLFLLISSSLSITSCRKEAIVEGSDAKAITSIDVSNATAQITNKTTFPLNEYLYTQSGQPYPLVNNTKLNAIDK